MTKPSILIIEDYKSLCLLYKEVFRHEFNTVIAESVKDVKNIPKHIIFDAIITDYDLGGEGFDAILPYLIQQKNAKRYMVTGSAVYEQLKEKYGNYFIEIYHKPVDVIKLKQIVLSSLSPN